MENMIQIMNNEQIKTWYSSSQLNNYKNKGKPIRLKALEMKYIFKLATLINNVTRLLH